MVEKEVNEFSISLSSDTVLDNVLFKTLEDNLDFSIEVLFISLILLLKDIRVLKSLLIKFCLISTMRSKIINIVKLMLN